MLKESKPEELKIYLEFSKPSRVFGGIEVKDIEEWKFCDVMELYRASKQDMLSTIFMAIDKLVAMPVDEAMQSQASEFTGFFRFVDDEIKKIEGYLEMLKTETKPELQMAGIDVLDKFGEYNIYRAIDPNPLAWDAISEVSFNKMFTKLLMDKEHAGVQERYNKIISKQNGHS